METIRANEASAAGGWSAYCAWAREFQASEQQQSRVIAQRLEKTSRENGEKNASSGS